MHTRRTRAIPLAIILGTVSVLLTIAILVAWTLLIVLEWDRQNEPGGSVWLLVAGIVSLVVIMFALVVFSVLLVREIKTGRRQTSFVDSVTHELKSPLASIKLCLETLGRPKLAEAQRAELLGMMKGDVERLTVFIDGVLETSRVVRSRAALRRVDVVLAQIVERSATAVSARHDGSASDISMEVPADLVVSGDPIALETIMTNLIDNAVKYSDDTAEVRITASVDGRGRALVEIRDRGVGIPPEELGQIFLRFYRVPNEAVRARRGTGLGLFIVRSLVRSMGGRVEAHSEGAGTGTTFRLRLPGGRGQGEGA